MAEEVVHSQYIFNKLKGIHELLGKKTYKFISKNTTKKKILGEKQKIEHLPENCFAAS